MGTPARTSGRHENGEWLPPFMDLLFPEVQSAQYEPLVDDLFIQHTDLVSALRRLDLLETLDRAQLPEHCEAILACSLAGKTRLLTEFIETRQPRWENNSLVVPALYIWTPETPTIKTVAAAILAQYREVPSRGETADQMGHRVEQLLINTQVRYVIYDDLHNAVDKSGQAHQEALTNWIRQISVRTRSSIITTGLPRLEDFLRLNEQLYNRFGSPTEIARFDWRIESHEARFEGVLQCLMGSIRAKFRLPAFDKAARFRWYVATGGRTGMAVRIARAAVKIARRANARSITWDHFHQAWEWCDFQAKRLPEEDRPFSPAFHGRQDEMTIAAALARGEETPYRQRRKKKSPAKTAKRIRRDARLAVS